VSRLVFDNTALSHFARAGRLDVLEVITHDFERVAPEQVLTEIYRGVPDRPALAAITTLDWLEVVKLTEIIELAAFAKYKAEFGGGPDKNLGESAVLGWASINGGIAIIDERTATRAAQRDNVAVHGTMWLVANGFRDGHLTRDDAEGIVDELAATEMSLPVDGAGFFAYAYREGLLP